jgi:hypothetical protein
MSKELDGCCLKVKSHQFFFNQEIQELIARVRTSRLSSDQYSIRGSNCIRYPSEKMSSLIQAESRRIEFPCLLEFECDDDALEQFNQPP